MEKLDSYTKNIQENFIISHFFLCMPYMAVLMLSLDYNMQTIYTGSGLIYLTLFLGIFALTPLQKKILKFRLTADNKLKQINLIYISIILLITLTVLALAGQKLEYRMFFAISVVLVAINCEWRPGLAVAIIISGFIFFNDYRAGNLPELYELDFIIAALFISLNYTVGKISENNNRLVKKLLWERAFSHNLLDNLPLAVIVSDTSGRIISCNNACREMFNLPFREITGMPEKEFWKYAGFNDEIFSAQEICNKEIKFNNRYFLVNRNHLQTKDENHVGTVTLLHDITEKREYEDKMKRIETLSVVGKMAAATAHEIKNPLTTIQGFIQLFMQKPGKRVSELKEHFELLLDEINRINKIITNFLQLARPRKPEPTRLNPQSLLLNTLKLVESEATYRNVKLILDKTVDLPEIYGDADQLKQVLLNLIQNAIQACPLGGCVKVTGRVSDDSRLHISIEDNGDGIPDEFVEKLFQPFFTTKETGTGLGLPISRRIIEDHGGEIEVDRSDLGGAKFTIKLPLYKVT